MKKSVIRSKSFNIPRQKYGQSYHTISGFKNKSFLFGKGSTGDSGNYETEVRRSSSSSQLYVKPLNYNSDVIQPATGNHRQSFRKAVASIYKTVFIISSALYAVLELLRLSEIKM